MSSKSKKRKRSDSSEEVEQLMLVVRKMQEDLRAKESELRSKEVELRSKEVELKTKEAEMESLRRERDRLYRTVPVAQIPRRHVDDLPDHILLRIFSLLDHAHLADVVVAVCKRWCNLVHEPSLWDRATLVYGNSKGVHTGAVAFIRTLAAATTLHALECGLSPADPHFVLHQLENCNTAASHVCFDLDTAAADAVLRVLWNSRAVLKELCVREGPLGQSDFSYSQACRFWEILEESPQLRTLVLFLRQSGGLANSLYSFRPSGCPSLRTLCLDVGVVEEHAMWTKPQLHIVANTIASTLIAAHRATLEDVRLPMRVMSSSKVVKALSRCPLLGRARLPVCLELHHLARCERLTELHLTSDYMQSAFNTEHLLQSICQLRQLQRLTVSPVGRCSDSLAVANGLIAALGELVELRRLYLTCLPTAEALDGLAASPTKAPHLELLHFSQSCGEAADGPCRLPALRRLLQWRRQLHVSMLSLKVHHGDVGPRCGKDHCTLAANNPNLPVVFVNHEVQGDQECAACETCAGFMRDVGGSILYLIEDSEFLDLPWRDASDLSVTSTPARGVPASTLTATPIPTPTPAHAPTLVPALPPALALTYVSSKEKGLAEPDKESRLALPALGQPGKAKITKTSAKSGQAVKKSKPRVKANPKPKSNPKPKAQPGSKKSAKKPSQKKVSPAASGSRVATVKVEGGVVKALKMEAVSPRLTSEVALPSPPPIEESVLLSNFPDMILPPMAGGNEDCLVKVIRPSVPRTVSDSISSTSRALAVQTCSSSTAHTSLAGTVSNTLPPTQADKMSGTGVVEPSASSPARPVQKRKSQPRNLAAKKPAAARRGRPAKEKVPEPGVPSPTAGDVTSQVSTLSAHTLAPVTPSISPAALVSCTLPLGISRLPSCETSGPQAEEKLEPSGDLPSTLTPTCAPASTPERPASFEEDFIASSAFAASPRRNQMRACRPVSLTDADDVLDDYVSTARKGRHHSAPRPRSPKTYPTNKFRKSAPAMSFFYNPACEAPFIAYSDASCDASCGAPRDVNIDVSAAGGAGDGPGGAPLDPPCDDGVDADVSCDGLSNSSSPPFAGFPPEPSACPSVIVVEVPSDCIKSDATAESDSESLSTREARVLEVLRSAQPGQDVLCQAIKVEGSEDALNNNGNSCASFWCKTKANTDPAWAQPVTVGRKDPSIYGNEQDGL